jgi:hypothetical protein
VTIGRRGPPRGAATRTLAFVTTRLDPRVERALPLLAAVLGPLVVALVVLPWREDVPEAAAALVMVVAVVALAARGHRAAGWLAAVAAAAWFDLFLTRPYGSFAIDSRDNVETAVLLVVVGVAVTEIAVRGRRHRLVAGIDDGYLRTIARVAQIAGAGNAHATAAAVREALTEVLGADEVRFERGALGGLPRLDADGTLRTDDGRWPVGQLGLPPMPFEIVAERGRIGYGRFVVHVPGGTPAEVTALRVAKVLADQAATALARA